MYCRLYEHPDPAEDIIRQCIKSLIIHAIDKSLNKGSDSNNTIRVGFIHEIYRRLFRNKLELYIDDFDSTYLTLGWNQCCRQYKGVSRTDYTDCKIRFPLTVTLYLDLTIVRKTQTYIEMIKMHIVKEYY